VCPPFLREASLGLAEEAKPLDDLYYKAKKQREALKAALEAGGIAQVQMGGMLGHQQFVDNQQSNQQFNNIPIYTVSNNTAPSVSYTGSALISNR
jgi:hypothetical protein